MSEIFRVLIEQSLATMEAGRQPAKIRSVLPLLDEAMAAAPGVQAATRYVLDRLDELARYRLPELPPF